MTDDEVTDFVTVICKLPQGITIDCGTPGKKDYTWVHVPGTPAGSKVGTVFGRAKVPANAWDSWLKRNKDLHFVKDGSVKAAPV